MDLKDLDDDEFVDLLEHVIMETHRRFEEVNVNLRVKKKGKSWQSILAADKLAKPVSCLEKNDGSDT